MNKLKLIMVGNGMAGVRALEELLKLNPDRYDITVFGSEPHPNYNRVLLSPVLAGEQAVEDIVLNDWAWYRQNHITLHAGATVTRVDRQSRTVVATMSDGTRMEAPYDRLILATGSRPFMLPIPGADLPGVMAYRDIADTQTMINAATQYRKAVVIGGGLLGLEAANGLIKRGMEVTVVHVGDWLLDRQLDAKAAGLLKNALTEQGMQFRLGAHTEALHAGPNGRVSRVTFKPQTTNGVSVHTPPLDADLVVMAVGIRPNTQLAESMRLHVDRGVVVTDTLQTVTDPRIYAVGECVAHRGVAYGLVAPLYEQASVLANHLAEWGIGRYTGSHLSAKLKVTGIHLFSAGNFSGGAGTEEIVLSDPTAPNGGVYKKLVLQGNKLVGACLYGDTADGSWYQQLVRDGTDVSAYRAQLMFGPAAAQAAAH